MKSSSVQIKSINVHCRKEILEQLALMLALMAVNLFKILFILFSLVGEISFLRAGSLGKKHLKGERDAPRFHA